MIGLATRSDTRSSSAIPAQMVWNCTHESCYCLPYRPRLKPGSTLLGRAASRKQRSLGVLTCVQARRGSVTGD